MSDWSNESQWSGVGVPAVPDDPETPVIVLSKREWRDSFLGGIVFALLIGVGSIAIIGLGTAVMLVLGALLFAPVLLALAYDNWWWCLAYLLLPPSPTQLAHSSVKGGAG